MDEKKTRGLGFFNVLTMMFVAAKLFGLIHWSWLIVFMPTIISVALSIAILILILILGIIFSV